MVTHWGLQPTANSPMLKLISPNSLLVGRINTRTSSGPFQMPTGPSQLMARVEQLYSAWYDVFNDTQLPLMSTAYQPEWYSSDDNLKVGDVVYFRKETGVLAGPWTIGMVDTAIRGQDDHVRELDIRYQNSAENKHRITKDL